MLKQRIFNMAIQLKFPTHTEILDYFFQCETFQENETVREILHSREHIRPEERIEAEVAARIVIISMQLENKDLDEIQFQNTFRACELLPEGHVSNLDDDTKEQIRQVFFNCGRFYATRFGSVIPAR